jgi:hypothetical protein
MVQQISKGKEIGERHCDPRPHDFFHVDLAAKQIVRLWSVVRERQGAEIAVTVKVKPAIAKRLLDVIRIQDWCVRFGSLLRHTRYLEVCPFTNEWRDRRSGYACPSAVASLGRSQHLASPCWRIPPGHRSIATIFSRFESMVSRE